MIGSFLKIMTDKPTDDPGDVCRWCGRGPDECPASLDKRSALLAEDVAVADVARIRRVLIEVVTQSILDGDSLNRTIYRMQTKGLG